MDLLGRRPKGEATPLSPMSKFNDAVDDYIFGKEPMAAKLHPEYARYADYDQLMRLEEWYGRGDLASSEGSDE